MNTKELTYLLQNASSLNKEQANALQKISEEFPYFQPVKSLLLKTLKDQESFRYNQELKKTAAYTADRSVLFDFITSPIFNRDNETHELKSKNKSDINVIDAEEIKTLPRVAMDDAIKMKMNEAEEVLDPALFSTIQEESSIKQTETATSFDLETNEKPKQNTEESLQIDKPLDFDKKEMHSFAEWLKLTSLKPIQRETDHKTDVSEQKPSENEPLKSLDQKNKFDLIDEFIANNPKIQPAGKNAPSRNLAKENQVATDELMTETLARVYLAQKNYKKAIQAYNILILKNPEKSGFFADQIRAIKKLQENK